MQLVSCCFQPLLLLPSADSAASASASTSVQPHHRRAVITLTSDCSGFADALTDSLVACLTSPAAADVTPAEAGILRTPDGRVFDSAALDAAAERLRLELDSAAAESSVADNVKRENRLYSYADQMAELELRRELAGKKGDRELQARLRAAHAEQLAAERAVRVRLAPVERRVDAAFQLMHCLIEALGRHLIK